MKEARGEFKHFKCMIHNVEFGTDASAIEYQECPVCLVAKVKELTLSLSVARTDLETVCSAIQVKTKVEVRQ